MNYLYIDPDEEIRREQERIAEMRMLLQTALVSAAVLEGIVHTLFDAKNMPLNARVAMNNLENIRVTLEGPKRKRRRTTGRGASEPEGEG